MQRSRILSLALLLLFPALGRSDGAPGMDLERDVLPIFRTRCYSCHDGARQRSSFRLDVRSTAFKGGESGQPAIVPGKAATSELVKMTISLVLGRQMSLT